jgi:hypothetical protein
MMLRTITTFTLAAVAMTAQLATAEMAARSDTRVAGDHQAHVAQLRHEAQDLAWEANKTKGSPSAEFRAEQLRVEGLIDDLESGRDVNSADIDRALDRYPASH